MTAGRQTFYEVLGVSAHAKTHEIERAYARIRTDMQSETSIPDARRTAITKVAYETLRDSGRRAEYDESIGLVATLARKKRKFLWGLAAVIAGTFIVVPAWFLLQRPARAPTGERLPSVAELVQSVGPRVGRVQGAMVSGEVRELGLAVETGQGEMTMPCTGLPPGMALAVIEGATTLRAELGRYDEAERLCRLAVKGVRDGAKPRPQLPPPQETLQAIVLDAKGEPQARAVSLARAIADPKGPAFAVKAAVALPNGTPIFDAQERLVGTVVAPHDYGDGIIAALGAARIVQGRGGNAVASAAPAPTTPPTKAQTASTPAVRGLGTQVGEGFTTLWKEDRDGSLLEVLDDVKKGSVGLPLAYWTRWRGGDGQVHASRCRVTGPGGTTVADYDQVPTEADTDDGYWYCALTRFQVELDDLPVGEYTFTQFVDGRQVAEASTRMERRIFTPGRLLILVPLLGLGLLLFLRRKRAVVNEVDRVI
jgi:hypothetical protein